MTEVGEESFTVPMSESACWDSFRPVDRVPLVGNRGHETMKSQWLLK